VYLHHSGNRFARLFKIAPECRLYSTRYPPYPASCAIIGVTKNVESNRIPDSPINELTIVFVAKLYSRKAPTVDLSSSESDCLSASLEKAREVLTNPITVSHKSGDGDLKRSGGRPTCISQQVE
jgi:hypothetical protein